MSTIAGPHLFLAQHFYELRMQEIRAEIEEKDERFRLVRASKISHIALSDLVVMSEMYCLVRNLVAISMTCNV